MSPEPINVLSAMDEAVTGLKYWNMQADQLIASRVAVADLIDVVDDLLEIAEMYLGLCDGQDAPTELSILTARAAIAKATGAA